MGLYIYQNPITNEIKEVFQKMNDIHEYIENNIKWNRLFTSPNASIDNNWDHNSPRDFVEKSAKKRGTVQDLWNKSAELSQKRTKERGIDAIKESHLKNWSKKRNNRRVPEHIKQGISPKDVVIEV
jgi:hypothetical protein